MMAHYGFDDGALSNTFNPEEHAQLLRNGSAVVPALEEGEPLRVGKYVHLNFGANGYESYVKIPNPLLGQTLEEGATISFWVKRTDNNLWDALFGFVNGTARFYMTGNTYVGFNDGNVSGTNNWIDINHPGSVTPTHLEVGKWQLVTLVIAPRNITLYVDGSRKAFARWNGSCNGRSVNSASGFDYGIILNHLSDASEFYLGRGSFWGSPDVLFDDVIVYNRPLSYSEVMGLNQMENRVFDFSTLNFLLGDVNEDGQVSVADVMDVVQYILGVTPSTFNVRAADINGDSQISVVDVTALVALILS
jgi:arabinan endo-1,5-alpha-L-arabinosidase